MTPQSVKDAEQMGSWAAGYARMAARLDPVVGGALARAAYRLAVQAAHAAFRACPWLRGDA